MLKYSLEDSATSEGVDGGLGTGGAKNPVGEGNYVNMHNTVHVLFSKQAVNTDHEYTPWKTVVMNQLITVS